MWRNTEKHTKAPENWSFAGPKHHGLACSTKAFFEHVRCQNVALEYTINQLRFHTNMWRNTQKSSWKSTLRKQKCGGTRKNPHQEATFVHEIVAKHTNQLRNCGKTQKNTWKLILRRAQTPWPGVFNQGVFRACPMSNRCAWIHHKSATLSHEHVAKHTEKQLKIDPAQAKCGGTRKNPHQKATFLHENVAKHTKTLENWSFAGPKHHGLACSTKAFFEHVRCQTVTLESTINQLRFHTNMWRNTHNSSWKSTLRSKNVAEHGGIKKLHFYMKMWQNTQINYYVLFSHEKVAKHTKKQLKIDPSQRRNTMAWRVQPRRFWARLADTRCQNVALEPCYCCDCCRHVIAVVLVVPNPSQGALPLAGRGRRIKQFLDKP